MITTNMTKELSFVGQTSEKGVNVPLNTPDFPTSKPAKQERK